MNDKYILEDHKAVLCNDLYKWGEWFQNADRHIAKTKIAPDVTISTVFLGLDHGFGVSPNPILFETMIFGGKYDQEMERYETWEDAENGHNRWVAKLTAQRGE